MTFSSTHSETRQQLVVVSRSFVATDVLEFEFQDASGVPLPSWSAGAHVDLKLLNGLSRQYSLMKGQLDPNNWRIAVLIEREGRGGSLAIEQEFQIGQTVDSLGPRNHFPLQQATEFFFIAGGIGITPIICMIDEAISMGAKWNLAYLGRSLATMAYASELKSTYGNQVVLYPKEQGELFRLGHELNQISETCQVYSCGPERLMLALESEMTGKLVDNLHLERFHPREIVDDGVDTEFIVYCQKSDEELVIPSDESLLMAADFAGIEISGDCMEGTCGACETRVIEGEIIHRDSVLSQKARAEGETMMICVSRARGRIVLDL